MSGYEVEHNVKAETDSAPSRRPDMSTFFATIDRIDTSGDRRPNNAYSVPFPNDVASAYRLFAEALVQMSLDQGEGATNGMLEEMVSSMNDAASHPPRELEGVPDSFLDELERVPKKSLKPSDTCPICAMPFLEDPYPLIVRLPCHKDHLFDYDCIRPWLKLNPTCPMDRQKLIKEKPAPPPKDEEEDFDEMYA